MREVEIINVTAMQAYIAYMQLSSDFSAARWLILSR